MKTQRPPRDSAPPIGAVLAGVIGGSVLLLWLVVTALPGPGTSEAPPAVASPGAQDSHATVPTPLDGPRLSEMSTVTVSASPRREALPPREPTPSSQPLPPQPRPAASFASGSPSSSLSRPPASSEEFAPDGLPASAMHCTFDGGVMTCGSCRMDSDCPAGQGCVANRETRRMECLSSDCEEDAHCFPGFACRAANRGDSGPIIRRCTPEGVRGEGETCDPGYISRGGACREGLRCVSAVCTVPCRRNDPTSCPDGYTCREGVDGPGCVPDCRQLGCPNGQRCKHIRDSNHQCLVSVVGTCPETPCAEGELCVKRLPRGRGAFWCARACNPIFPDSCPSGYVCGMASPTTSACFRACDPHDVSSCDEGWTCGTVSEDMRLWGCHLDPPP